MRKCLVNYEHFIQTENPGYQGLRCCIVGLDLRIAREILQNYLVQKCDNIDERSSYLVLEVNRNITLKTTYHMGGVHSR